VNSLNVIAQTQIGQDIDGEAAGAYSGKAASLSNDGTVAIGAPYNDDNGIDDGEDNEKVSGISASWWSQVQKDLAQKEYVVKYDTQDKSYRAFNRKNGIISSLNSGKFLLKPASSLIDYCRYCKLGICLMGSIKYIGLIKGCISIFDKTYVYAKTTTLFILYLINSIGLDHQIFLHVSFQ
jgi:hypothetical protein